MNSPVLTSPSPRRWHFFWPVFWAVLALLGLAALCYSSEDAREVTWDTIRTVLGILCTPFILESASILLGICILMAIRHYQDKREGDGWVYLATQEPEEKNLPKALTERLQSVVMTDKPTEPDDNAARQAVIEGYLELGMGAQALTDFQSADWPDDLAASLLRSRVLAANMDTESSITHLRATASRFPTEKHAVASTALEISTWVNRHLHQQPLVKLWRDEAERILQASIV